ncbi:MAG: response regulator [Candidatus Omnitrophica bacterium]|nr:response regulator [Candidatus Omnitrophota bacterium]
MKKLLIVDDENLMRDFAKPFFEKQGYSVLYSASGKEGLEVFQKESPDAVLLDLGLPDIDGKDVLVKMKGLNKQAKIIVLTGFSDDEIKEKILPLGPDAYFTKPCKLPLIAEKIKELL